MLRAVDEQSAAGDPFGKEALTFTKDLILQKEVSVGFVYVRAPRLLLITLLCGCEHKLGYVENDQHS